MESSLHVAMADWSTLQLDLSLRTIDAGSEDCLAIFNFGVIEGVMTFDSNQPRLFERASMEEDEEEEDMGGDGRRRKRERSRDPMRISLRTLRSANQTQTMHHHHPSALSHLPRLPAAVCTSTGVVVIPERVRSHLFRNFSHLDFVDMACTNFGLLAVREILYGHPGSNQIHLPTLLIR